MHRMCFWRQDRGHWQSAILNPSKNTDNSFFAGYPWFCGRRFVNMHHNCVTVLALFYLVCMLQKEDVGDDKNMNMKGRIAFDFCQQSRWGLTQGLTGGGGLSNELGPNIAWDNNSRLRDIWWKREWGWGSCMWDLVLPPVQAQAGGPGSFYPWPQNHKDRNGKARGTNIGHVAVPIY